MYPPGISFNHYLKVESLISLGHAQISACQNGSVKTTCPLPKCSVLFLQGQLGVLALSLGRRKGLGWGLASLLGQHLDPCPGSPGLVKNLGAWGLDMEDQVSQVSWWLPHPLQSSRAPLQARGWAGGWAGVRRVPSHLPPPTDSYFLQGRLGRSPVTAKEKFFLNTLPGLFGSQVGRVSP